MNNQKKIGAKQMAHRENSDKSVTDRPIMLDSMVQVFIDSNPNAGTSRDVADAMATTDISTPERQQDFKRGYVAGFLYSIGIDRRTMKFTCDVCHKRKAAAKRSANLTDSRPDAAAGSGTADPRVRIQD